MNHHQGRDSHAVRGATLLCGRLAADASWSTARQTARDTPALLRARPSQPMPARPAVGARLRSHVRPLPARPVPPARGSLGGRQAPTLSFIAFLTLFNSPTLYHTPAAPVNPPRRVPGCDPPLPPPAARAPFPPHAFAGFSALPGLAPRAILGYNNRRRRAVYR